MQLAGFTDLSVYNQLLPELQQVEFFKYFRLLNGQPYLVTTSQVFTSKEKALEMVNNLPDNLKNRGPWIKQLSAIKADISAYRSSL